jgi:hypothetical protein
MFTETRSPLQNLFTPAVVGSTADMSSPLPFRHANTLCYVGAFSSLESYWLIYFRLSALQPRSALVDRQPYNQ